MEGGKKDLGPGTVVAVEAGDFHPGRSCMLSMCGLFGVSNTPMAFVFTDPIAGAAFWPSIDPTLNLLGGRKDTEFVVDTIDSVGLPGGTSTTGDIVVLEVCCTTGTDMRGSCGEEFTETFDPLIVANRRLRSSKGATAALPVGRS